MKNTFQIVTLTAPSAWASYLINADPSGLSEKEIQTVDAWLTAEKVGYCVSCEDAGFRSYHDAWGFEPLAADCQTYSFLI